MTYIRRWSRSSRVTRPALRHPWWKRLRNVFAQRAFPIPTFSSAARYQRNPISLCAIAARASSRPILLLAHTDVVEAKREDWSIDPFTFTEKDGYFYGRGTADDKAQAAVWIANLIRYKREGYQARPRHDRRAHGGRGRRRAVQRRRVAAEESPRSDRCRVLPQRGRQRADGERQTRLKRYPGSREMVHRSSARGSQQGRPQLAPGIGQRDLPSCGRARAAEPVRISAENKRGYSRSFLPVWRRSTLQVRTPDLAKVAENDPRCR